MPFSLYVKFYNYSFHYRTAKIAHLLLITKKNEDFFSMLVLNELLLNFPIEEFNLFMQDKCFEGFRCLTDFSPFQGIE